MRREGLRGRSGRRQGIVGLRWPSRRNREIPESLADRKPPGAAKMTLSKMPRALAEKRTKNLQKGRDAGGAHIISKAVSRKDGGRAKKAVLTTAFKNLGRTFNEVFSAAEHEAVRVVPAYAQPRDANSAPISSRSVRPGPRFHSLQPSLWPRCGVLEPGT